MRQSDDLNLTYLHSLPGAYELEDDFMNPYAKAGSAAFLCYDLTSLRNINYAFGRAAGDALLATVAQWATEHLGGKLYRIDGDLFCLAYKDRDIQEILDLASTLDARFGQVWRLDIGCGHVTVFAQASIAVIGNLE